MEEVKDFTRWSALLRGMYGISAKVFADKRGLSREDWLEIRKQGVGGSEIGAILGHSKYACAIDIYLDKLGRSDLAEEISDEKQAIMDSGSDMEELILELYRKKTGRKVVTINAVLQHPTVPHAIVNVDAIAQREDGTWGILEVKNSLAMGKEWKDGKVPLMYEDQCRHGMWITGLHWGEVVSLRSGRWVEGSRYLVEESPEWEASAEEAIYDFWECVQTKTLPRIPQEVGVGHTIWREAMARVAGEIPERSITASPYLDRSLLRYKELKAREKEVKEEIEALGGIIADELGGPGEVSFSGGQCSWKQNKPTSSFDRKAFAKEYPEIEEKFVVMKPGAFVLRMK